MADDLSDWLRKASSAIYLACDASVADDISPRLKEAAGTIDRQREEIGRLLKIVRGFLDCPELADCAPGDKDIATHDLERAALIALSDTTREK